MKLFQFDSTSTIWQNNEKKKNPFLAAMQAHQGLSAMPSPKILHKISWLLLALRQPSEGWGLVISCCRWGKRE